MDQVSIAKSELRFQQWTKLVAECQSSQMTVKAWCELNNINIKTYYYWLTAGTGALPRAFATHSDYIEIPDL